MCDNQIDRIAEALHDGWWQARLDAGFTLGPNRDYDGKTHPHLVPWSALDEENRSQDRFEAARIIKMLEENPKVSDECIAKAIHEACAEYKRITNQDDTHGQDPWDKKPYGKQEHLEQARWVQKVWKEMQT